MSGVDAAVSHVSVRKRRSGVASSSRFQISVACLLSKQVSRSMHDIKEWSAGGCWFVGGTLCAVGMIVVNVGAVGVVM